MTIKSNRLDGKVYEENFSDIHPPFDTPEGASVEANRCLFCYDAPCTKSCPTGIDVPQFIREITTSNFKGSAKTIFDSNILGAGCSRVCPVEKLCEGACVYNERGEEPIQIGRLQRYAIDWYFERGMPKTALDDVWTTLATPASRAAARTRAVPPTFTDSNNSRSRASGT